MYLLYTRKKCSHLLSWTIPRLWCLLGCFVRWTGRYPTVENSTPEWQPMKMKWIDCLLGGYMSNVYLWLLGEIAVSLLDYGLKSCQGWRVRWIISQLFYLRSQIDILRIQLFQLQMEMLWRMTGVGVASDFSKEHSHLSDAVAFGLETLLDSLHELVFSILNEIVPALFFHSGRFASLTSSTSPSKPHQCREQHASHSQPDTQPAQHPLYLSLSRKTKPLVTKPQQEAAPPSVSLFKRSVETAPLSMPLPLSSSYRY